MKNLRTLVFASLTLVMLIAGCTVGGKPFQSLEPTSEEATIYVYRPRTFVGGAVSYPIFINGTKVTTLPHTAYYAHRVEPGDIFVTARTPENEASVKIEAEAGEAYYIKGGTATGQFSGRATLHEVHPKQGKEEIKDCVYYPAHDELRK